MLEQHRDISRHIEDLLDGGVDTEDDPAQEDLYASSRGWYWLTDPDTVTAFDTLWRLAGPDTDLWTDIEDTFTDLAHEYAQGFGDTTRRPVLGEQPTAREYADYVFSRTATLPPPGSPVEVGEWLHDGTGTHAGVTFTAFTALGIEEHLGFAVLTDGTHNWVVRYSPV